MSNFKAVPSATRWPKLRGKFLFRQRRERTNRGDVQLTASQVYGVISQSKFNELSNTRATTALAGTENFLHVDEGDFVISLRTFEGGIERALERGCISPAYTVMCPSSLVEPTFFYFFLKSSAFIQTLQTAVTGIRDGKSVRYDQFANLLLPTPDLATQRRIADFLDRETARIDRLVDRKERLVKLIGEKRSALITAAVTGQIDPQTGKQVEILEFEIRKSGEGGRGVEGSRCVIKVRLRHVAELSNSNVDKLTVAGEVPVRLCNYVDVYKNERIDNSLDFMRASASPAEIKRFGLRAGDVIITKDSEDSSDIGIPAFVAETSPDLVCGYHLTLLRCRQEVMRGGYLFWALNSKPVREQMSNAANGVTRYGLTLGGMKDVRVPLPDLSTQRRIADFLDRETEKLDQIVEKVLSSINRLREFRAALVTAAVTGQIDVATWGREGKTDRRLDRIEEVSA